MSSELVPLPGVIVPGSMSSDALPGLSRSPLSDYALNLADVHQLMLERVEVSALVVSVKEGVPLGVGRLLQFTPFNPEELSQRTMNAARMFGTHSPDKYVLAHLGVLADMANSKTGMIRNSLIDGPSHGLMPYGNGVWSQKSFVMLPEHLEAVFGMTKDRAASYLHELFRVVDNPISFKDTFTMSPKEMVEEIVRRAAPPTINKAL